jgi:hypothetical protein
VDRNLWHRLYLAVMTTAYPDPAMGVHYGDRVIALVYLWAVTHRRPTTWACHPRHWERWARRPELPTQPTMSRRLRAAAVGRLLDALVRRFRGHPQADWVRYLDGYPLLVGNYSKDPDATVGYGAGGFYRGYRLHACWAQAAAPVAWTVTAAAKAESVVARVLSGWLVGRGYLVADAAYDSNRLFAACGRRGHQLVAPPKKRGRGLGHHRQAAERVRCRDLLAGSFGRALYASRPAIERWFSRLAGVGLGPLPPWVRRMHRVRRWVQAHLLLLATHATIGQPLPKDA